MNRMNKKKAYTLILIVIVLIISIGRFYNFVSNYYEPTDNAWSYINSPADDVKVEYVDNTIVFTPTDVIAENGLIFYPGGLVQTEAYAPLMEKLAENNIQCILIQMPLYLAMFDANGARGIQAKYPNIKNWYLAGHSLGGAMASLYAQRHINEYNGLILLAAYSITDLSDFDLKILSVRGSNDEILNMDNYNKYLSNLPDDYTEIIIEGGCHGYFGDYGMQAGDGIPTISVEEQTDETVESIVDFIK